MASRVETPTSYTSAAGSSRVPSAPSSNSCWRRWSEKDWCNLFPATQRCIPKNIRASHHEAVAGSRRRDRVLGPGRSLQQIDRPLHRVVLADQLVDALQMLAPERLRRIAVARLDQRHQLLVRLQPALARGRIEALHV